METLFLVLRVAVSLGVVLAVIWFAHRRIGRARARTRADAPIAVVGRQSLAPKAQAVLVELDGRRLLLGVTEQGVTVLSDREAPVASEVPDTAEPFAEALRRAEAGAIAGSPTAAPAGAPTPTPSPTPSASQGLQRGSILSAETWKRSLTGIKEGLGI